MSFKTLVEKFGLSNIFFIIRLCILTSKFKFFSIVLTGQFSLIHLFSSSFDLLLSGLCRSDHKFLVLVHRILCSSIMLCFIFNLYCSVIFQLYHWLFIFHLYQSFIYLFVLFSIEKNISITEYV